MTLTEGTELRRENPVLMSHCPPHGFLWNLTRVPAMRIRRPTSKTNARSQLTVIVFRFSKSLIDTVMNANL